MSHRHIELKNLSYWTHYFQIHSNLIICISNCIFLNLTIHLITQGKKSGNHLGSSLASPPSQSITRFYILDFTSLQNLVAISIALVEATTTSYLDYYNNFLINLSISRFTFLKSILLTTSSIIFLKFRPHEVILLPKTLQQLPTVLWCLSNVVLRTHLTRITWMTY